MGIMKPGWRWFVLAFTIVLMGCVRSGPSESKHIGTATLFDVDSTFKEFYDRLGGQVRLGPCITPKFEMDGLFYQYTANALMVYDPNVTSFQRYQLASIGKDIPIAEGGVDAPERGVIYINGHRIWEEAAPIYEKLGSSIVGAPLTDVRYNPSLRRYEQYFENMGFYRMETDPAGNIHLLTYGAWACGDFCQYQAVAGNIILPDAPLAPSEPALRAVDEAIDVVAARLGRAITGQAISATHVALDGKFEKIYEYLVIIADPDNPSRPYVRPLVDALHIPPDTLELRDAGQFFFTVEGDQGYNIPAYFMEFIKRHGGMETSGTPVTRQYSLSSAVTRQCYMNLCLEYHSQAPESLRVRPALQGYIYKDLYYRPANPTPVPAPSLAAVSLKVWEEYPLLDTNQEQIIYTAVYEHNVPVRGVDLKLTVTLPDGAQKTYAMAATDSDGQTSFRLDRVRGDTGTLVPYQVCVVSPAIEQTCDTQGFLIWDAP